MNLKEFPQTARAELADLALAVERGELTREQGEQVGTELVASLRTILGLDASWQNPPSPPVPHNPAGRQMVFWKGTAEPQREAVERAVLAAAEARGQA